MKVLSGDLLYVRMLPIANYSIGILSMVVRNYSGVWSLGQWRFAFRQQVSLSVPCISASELQVGLGNGRSNI